MERDPVAAAQNQECRVARPTDPRHHDGILRNGCSAPQRLIWTTRLINAHDIPPSDAPMSCQGFLDSCSARRLVICWARCSALARDRPVVVMTLRLPRRSRMSQVRPGGRPRELVEPVSIWTVTGGTADHFRGLARGRVRWAGGAGVAGLRTRQGGAAPGGGQALIRSRPAGQMGSGDGRRIVRRPARMRQPNIGPGRPRGSGGQPAAARRWG